MTRALPLVSLMLAACSDGALTKVNSVPAAQITSHRDGDTVREGFPVLLRGVVEDPNHSSEDLLTTWRVDGASACDGVVPDATGVVECEARFSVGGGDVILEVRDPEGGSGTARVKLEVQPTDAPTAELLEPLTEGVYYSDRLISFRGRVGDAEDAADALTVTWETNALGDLGLRSTVTSDGAVEAFGNLPEGEHAVSLHVVDSTGREARDSVVIRVGPPNSAPSCAITEPVDGSSSRSGGTIGFAGTVGDVDVPLTSLSIEWSSDQDGPMGTSAPDSDGTVRFPYAGLSVATHLVTLTVTDDVGERCSDTVMVTVGTPPVIVVDAPTDGDVVNEGDLVSFAARAYDTEDALSDLTVSWVSDVDGLLFDGRADATGGSRFNTSGLTAGPHLVTATATDTDGLSSAVVVRLNVNEPPTAPTVTITPDPATTTDDLTATAGGSVDPDSSAPVSYRYAWYDNGVLSGASTSSVFPAASTQKRRTYRVEVTPTDGIGDGPVGTAEITVINTAPALSGPTLSASVVSRGDTLVCSASASDVDPSDSPVVTYVWSDGSTGRSYTVTAGHRAGDTITCTATADDGDGGLTSASVSATVQNTAPVVSSVSIAPSAPRTNDTLAASATVSDPDGDAYTLRYDWTVDGVLVVSGSSSTLSGVSWFEKGQMVTVTVVADDGSAASSATSAPVTVRNTAPSAPGIAISPSSPTAGVNPLFCSIATASTDVDRDSVNYTFSWARNGSAWTGSTSSTSRAGDTIPAASTVAGDAWTCTVTPDDGTDLGTAASASVTITSATTDYVMFTTDATITGSRWLSDRSAANTYCATYAAANGIRGSDFRIFYSTATENARDYVTYNPTAGDRIFDRYGTRIDGGNLYSGGSISLSDLRSWTITNTGTDGRFASCSSYTYTGGYTPTSWPICQYCSQQAACVSSSSNPLRPSDCCWTGDRAVICMGRK